MDRRLNSAIERPTPGGILAVDVAGRAHLIGAGGAGMSALAAVLAARGWRLSGSDVAPSPPPIAGFRPHVGHAAAHVPADADVVIYSDAVTAENPELRRAAELGAPVLSYFQALGQLTATLTTLAIAGTHGKSTTTAMAAVILRAAGLDPTVVCGGVPLGEATGGRAGGGAVAAVEACEYRENFRHLRPHSAVVLNVEPDHFDYYTSRGQLEAAFARFVAGVSGGLVLAADLPPTIRAAAGGTVETFSVAGPADWSADNVRQSAGRYAFDVVYRGRRRLGLPLAVAGGHQVGNALAAIAATARYGTEPVHWAALAGFAGLRRRLERLADWRGAARFDDYAHHPTEIAATLKTLREIAPRRRLVVVFQPHQVSRTRALLDELAASLENSDAVAVADIFAARETPDPGDVTAADLAGRIGNGLDVLRGHRLEDIARRLAERLRPGDVLATLGAGDVGRLHRLLDAIC